MSSKLRDLRLPKRRNPPIRHWKALNKNGKHSDWLAIKLRSLLSQSNKG
ncbi:hypothetical protein Golax_011078 [Gossypium laxum]|uniref:Uncharacterized protein n=1 Tax=Gossypium laxum TaxID=34288 RepID=A0A7J8ZKY3_9ROSI|nr:hypothetical protein [Gossypium laxum]